MKILLLICLPLLSIAQQKYEVTTFDIDNFWKAYDLLKKAKTKADSIKIIQEEYINQSTAYFKAFIKVRNFTAEEYVQKIGTSPKFWKSIRPLTENISNRKSELEIVFQSFEKELPNFKSPNVCFAIGCLRTGGTTSKNLILIGSEIAAADNSVNKSELNPWLNAVLGGTGDIVSMVAHEAVHTRQKPRMRSTLLTAAISEGVCDFITMELLGMNINATIHEYGDQHECELWKDFEVSMKNNKRDFSNWLYNGNSSEDRPADLGYYIGFKIAESYYEKMSNKRKALKVLLNKRKYKKVFKKSKYWKKCK